MTVGPNVRIAGSSEDAAQECAVYISECMQQILQSQARATLAISGGNTPRPMFAALARASIDWSRVHFFWVDERCVPPDDKQSNFKLANDALFSQIQIPVENLHRVRGELEPRAAAGQYIGDIKEFFSLTPGELPEFDMVHRGMGADAHTASLFPGDPLINNRTDIAAAVWVEKLKSHRVTLLRGVLEAARRTVLQVSGEDKREALRAVLRGPEDPVKYPCQIASRKSNTTWFLDEAAAALL